MCFVALGNGIPTPNIPFLSVFVLVIIVLLMIIFVIMIAMLISLSKCSIVEQMGRESLLFCAFEGYYKQLFAFVFLPFGLTFTYTNEIGSLIWLLLCMISCHYTVIPLIRWITGKILR